MVMHQNLSSISIKTKNICNKAVETSASTIQFAPECYKTQKMCDKAVDTSPLVFDSVLD